MSRSLRCCLVLLCALSLADAPARPEAAAKTCPLSAVRAGQTAVAKSVFRGTKVESFHLEIIGVLPKFDGTRSVILGRILDGPVVQRKSGVIGGMSGSPVYIGGRLAGAIALTWAWSKEPIAGITPIEDMLSALREKAPAKSGPAATGAYLPSPLRVSGSLIGRVQISGQPPEQPDSPGVMTLVPLGGVVQAAGFGARGLEQLRQQLAPYGLRVGAGGAGPQEKLRPRLEPGAALGARLIGGDFDLTGLGTVTMVEGGRVLGFGHPLFQRGDVDLPMTGGYVYDILPSIYFSNKVMSPTQTVGRIYKDHQSAIAGAVGGRADMLPVSIEVEDRDVGHARRFAVQVARIRDLTPGLVTACVVTAVDETRGRISRGAARVRVEIEAEGRTIVREDLDYSLEDAAMAAVPGVLAPLTAFMENPFGELKLKGMRVEVKTQEQEITAAIERLVVNQSRVKAGDEVCFTATVRPYRGKPVEIPLKLRVPGDLPKGEMRLVVTGGAEADQARSSIGAPKPEPTNLDQLVERYVSRRIGSDLVLQAVVPRGGVSMLGEELRDLPRSALEALSASRPTDLRPLPSLMTVVVPTQWVLTGKQALTVPIESTISAPGLLRPPKEGPPEEEEEPEEASAFPRGGAMTTISQLANAVELAAPAPPEGEGKKEEPETALTRAPDVWTQSSAGDYDDWKLDNVALRADGALSLGLKRQDVASIPADVVWSLAVREGDAYVGTGSEGRVFRVSAEGKLSEFFATGEMNVHALALGPDGTLYAATSPRGKLFQITPEGKGKVILDSGSTYLWSLAVAPDGTLYAGGGSPARIYVWGDGESWRLLAELPATNVLSLALAPSGDLYAGTSDLGVIYRVRPGGEVAAVGQVRGASVDSLAVDDKGNLFASSSPGGEIYRLAPGGDPELYLETGQQTIFELALLADGTPVAGTGSRGLVLRAVARLKPELVFRPDAGIATAVAEFGGELWVATSGPAALRRFGPERSSSGSAESQALDAERPARWGRLTWVAETPAGTQVSGQTRSGDTPTPGDHWSAWEPTVQGAIASPTARYLQYRLVLSTETPTGTPVVRQVTVSRQPQNRPPVLGLRSPEPGQRLSKQQTVKWQAQDPDKDTLCYRIEVSPDFGETWQEVAKNLRELKYDWDTKQQKDGQYLVRITATDGLSVPSDPRTGDASQAIWVDNTPPVLALFRSSLSVDDKRQARVTGVVTDEISPVRSVEYRVDEGEWASVPLAAVEGAISDIAVLTDPLEAGKHKLGVRAFDAAGNSATDTVEVEVKESAAAGQPQAAPSAEPQAAEAGSPAAQPEKMGQAEPAAEQEAEQPKPEELPAPAEGGG